MIQSRHLALETAPEATDFTTVDAVTASLGAFATEPQIEELIEQVSGEIADSLAYPEANGGGHPLAEAEYVETVRLCGGEDRILLSRRFLTADPVVTEDGVAVDAADIETDFSAGIVRRLSGGALSCFTASVLTFTYTAGFVMPPVVTNPTAPSRRLPKQVERAAIDLVAYRWTLATGQPCGQVLTQISLPGAGTLNFNLQTPELDASRAIPGHVTTILDKYRFPLSGWV